MAWTKEQQRESNRKSYHKHKAKRIAKTKEAQRRLRREVLVAYGGESPACACCGESIIEFLSIDHINGGGTQHRKEVGSSYRMYRWLKNNSFPDGHRVLCHNCNQAMSWGRKCPHELLEGGK